MNKINLQSVDFNLLKTFQVLFEERHVGNSAARMNISQSAMSHALSRLRRTFDDRLFERSASGILPTDKAESLAKDIAVIIAKVNALFEDEVLDVANLGATVTIMTHDFIAANFLQAIFVKIKAIAPKVKFSVRLLTPNWHELLESGEVDLVLGSGLNSNKKFESHAFYIDELVCLVDKANPALSNWTVKEVYAHQHIKFSLLDAKIDPVDVYAKKHNITRDIGIITESLQLHPSLLVNTQFIAFLPKTLAESAAKMNHLSVVACPFKLPELTIKCIWNQKQNNNPKHRWLRAFFKIDTQ